MIDITLTEAQFRHAALAGFLRQAENIVAGRRDGYGFTGDGWAAHILGAVGEYAVAAALGIHWPGPGTLRAPDVGQLQVRTRNRHSYELIIHPADENAAAFVLVTTDPATPLVYRVHGWLLGRHGKRREWWNDPAGGRAAYFIPQASLRPLGELAGLRVAA